MSFETFLSLVMSVSLHTDYHRNMLPRLVMLEAGIEFADVLTMPSS